MAAAFGDEARGIGLGSQLSQLVQLAQLDPIDHYATEVARPAFYIRYMDDFLLIDTDREKLTAAAREIEKRLNALGLELNPKSQLLPLRSGFVFLKWRFHLTPTGKVIMRAAQGVAKEEKATPAAHGAESAGRQGHRPKRADALRGLAGAYRTRKHPRPAEKHGRNP